MNWVVKRVELCVGRVWDGFVELSHKKGMGLLGMCWGGRGWGVGD